MFLLENPLIITHNGASGVFAGCTDLAYQRAVEDGADVIDCSVQMSKDGVPFCLDSADLMGDTTAVTSFMSRTSMIPEIQKGYGIFSFDLAWNEIQTLKRKVQTLALPLAFDPHRSMEIMKINIKHRERVVLS